MVDPPQPPATPRESSTAELPLPEHAAALRRPKGAPEGHPRAEPRVQRVAEGWGFQSYFSYNLM